MNNLITNNTIITPENVELDYEIADIGSRFLATAIDFSIQTLLLFGALFPLDLLNLQNLESKVSNLFSSITGAIFLLLSLLITVGYYAIQEAAFNGQTIGKRLLNLRVRRENGAPIGLWESLLRNIIRLIDFFPFFYSSGLICMFFNQKAKRLGDLAAGTIVIRELPRKKISKLLKNSNSLANFPPEFSFKYPWLSTLLSVTKEADLVLIEKLIERQPELSNLPELALKIYQVIIARLDASTLPTVTESEASEVLQELYYLYSRAHNLYTFR